MNFSIHKIEPAHNSGVAHVVRTVLEEHEITMPGTAYHDKSLDFMFEQHSIPGSMYFVACKQNRVVGGSGIFPTEGLDSDTCELVKMYVLKEFRGHGMARALLTHCLRFAQEAGYKKVYLETLPQFNSAVGMYEKHGFQKLDKPLGNTGHFACTLRMLKIF